MAPFLQELRVGRNGTWLWKCRFGILTSASNAENAFWSVRTRSFEARYTNRPFCNPLPLLSNLIRPDYPSGRDLTTLCKFPPRTAPVARFVSMFARLATRARLV